MPIKPENLARYPPDWPQIRERIRARAQDRCEQCGVSNHDWGFRLAGTFYPVNKHFVIGMVKRGREWVRPPVEVHMGANYGLQKIIEIVCTVAHLDHTPENCADDNLRFLCQRCHLLHDLQHHKETAYATRRQGKAIDMFEVHL